MRPTSSASLQRYKYAWLPLTGIVAYGMYQGYQSYGYIYNMVRYTSENQGRNYNAIPRCVSVVSLPYLKFIGGISIGTITTYYSYRFFYRIFLARKPSIHRVSSISDHPIVHHPSLVSPSLALPSAPSSTVPKSLFAPYYQLYRDRLIMVWTMLGPRATGQSYRQFGHTYNNHILSLFLSLCISLTFTPIVIAKMESYCYPLTDTNAAIPWGNQRRKQYEQKRKEEQYSKYLQEKKEEEKVLQMQQQSLPSLFTGRHENDG